MVECTIDARVRDVVTLCYEPMDINHFPKSKPDGSPVLSFGEAYERYQAGTLDPETKEIIDRTLQDTFEGLRKYVQEHTEQFAEALVPFFASSAQISHDLAATVGASYATSAQVQEAWARMHAWTVAMGATIIDHIALLQEKMSEALPVLAQHGWFFDMEMPPSWIWEIQDAFTKGEIDDANDVLCDHFEDRLDEIESSISAKFPNRSHVIKPAFAAHRRGEYVLSIPVLLAQADGISKEVMGASLFLLKDKPKMEEHISSLRPHLIATVLSTLLEKKLPIKLSERERPTDFDGLNRHLVLHGVSLDYGTRLNAYKAISLLNYVAEYSRPKVAEAAS